MEYTVTEFVQIFSLIIATVVAGLSLFTFRRNKNIELQNHLFQLKMVAFSNLISEFVKMLSIIDKSLTRADKIKRQQTDLEKQNHHLDKLIDKVDQQIIDINKEIGKNSVYFSSDVTKLLMNLINRSYGDIEGLDYNDLVKVKEFYNLYVLSLTEEMDKIIDKMREELGLEKLNEELFKRVKKGKLNPVAPKNEN